MISSVPTHDTCCRETAAGAVYCSSCSISTLTDGFLTKAYAMAATQSSRRKLTGQGRVRNAKVNTRSHSVRS